MTWWRGAVIYQVYIRSFADGDGDGLGDITGVRAHLDYLADLGVDAIWVNPWYPSPMADAGYDVSDYRAVEPRFGTMADAEALVIEAHQRGLRVLLDIVPNHSSDHHRWFQEALRAPAGSPARARYIFRDGLGKDGSTEPNNWRAVFGGSAWNRVTEPNGRLGQWYLHLFAPEQPDLNWENPDVRADFVETLRFWFDRGVDGFRIDVAHSLIKADGLPDLPTQPHPLPHPYWDVDGVHEVYREWRAVADSYDPPRVFVAEAWVAQPERLALYVRNDELHTAFNFDYLVAAWTAKTLRRAIDQTLDQHAEVGAPPTWVLSNHDVARHRSRYAREQTTPTSHRLDELIGRPADRELGLRRARAAVLLTLALPGGAYVYQGEELGLEEVEDLPDELLQDPTWIRSNHTDRGRDGCRVPIPWSGTSSPFGFSPIDATAPPWLPQPASWAVQTVEALTGDPGSILELYRSALHARRENKALGDGTMTWSSVGDDALGFERDPDFACVVNFADAPVAIPSGWTVTLASGPLTSSGQLPADTTVWLER